MRDSTALVNHREVVRETVDEAITGEMGKDASVFRIDLMEEVVERSNLLAALQKVVSNKGAAGIDGMSTQSLKQHLKQCWPTIKEQLIKESLTLTELYSSTTARMLENAEATYADTMVWESRDALELKKKELFVNSGAFSRRIP